MTKNIRHAKEPRLAGYSGRSLVEKLGLKSHMRVLFQNSPDDYSITLGPLPLDVTVLKRASGLLNFIQIFVTRRRELENAIPRLVCNLTGDGALWISWPKGSSGVPTDLKEAAVRAVVLPHDLVDVKVCAVDETWSGLKFVFRLKNR